MESLSRLKEHRRHEQKKGATHVALWIDLHFRHGIIELHVLFADFAAVFDYFDSLSQSVGLDDPGFDGSLRDECDAGSRYVGLG